MKNFTKLLILALAVSLVAAVFVFNASAAVTEPGVNPNDLKPGSNRVIFIQDAPRDPETNMCKWDELPGNGSGSSPDNPLRPVEHELFDPTADIPMYDVTTAFYQATEMLMEVGGGTIVITGPVYFGRNEVYGSSATQADTRTANFGNNVIKFTSVYNGVDYRETNGAKISIEQPAMLSIDGSSIWEKIDIETLSFNRSMNFNFYATKIGEGIRTYPASELFVDVPIYYVSLAAGHRYAKSTGENPTLLVQSGTYNKVVAQWGGAVVEAKDITSYITIEGTAKVKGILCGTVHQMVKYTGHVNITINGGIFEGDINGVGSTGFENTDGVVTFKINGGNFANAYGINAADITNTGNAPASTVVDFSGWKGSEAQLAYAVALVADKASGIDAKFVRVPEGKTISGLVEYAYSHPYDHYMINGWYKENDGWYYYTDGVIEKNTWKEDSIGRVYLGSDGRIVRNDFVRDTNGWCYVGADGYSITTNGWKLIGKDWYFFDNGYRVQNAWKQDSIGWCYVGSDGKMVTNDFAKDSTGWCYIGSDGYFVTTTGWKSVNGHWYYLDKGYRVHNSWKIDSIGWCYVGSDGKMVTNDFAKDSTGWCYIGSDGYFVTTTGWKSVNGHWYYLDKGYRVHNSWKMDSIGWCYVGSDGKMITNDFVKDSIGWSYLGTDGYFVTETRWVYVKEEWYYIKKGYRIDNTWQKDGDYWYYLGSDGKMLHDTWKQDSIGWCYLGADGKMVTDTYVKDSQGNCYIDKNGYWDGKYVEIKPLLPVDPQKPIGSKPIQLPND